MCRHPCLVLPLLLTLLLASACAPRFAAEEAASPMALEPPRGAGETWLEPGTEAEVVSPQDAPAPARAVARAALPPLPPQRPAFPRVEAASLQGISAEGALSILGPPRHARNSGGVNLWVYEHEACRLTLRFHFSVRDNKLRALGHGIESGLETGLHESICLHLLARPDTRMASNPGD